MKTLNVNLEKDSYNIYLGSNLNLNNILKAYIKNRLFIITDSNVYKLYKSFIEERLTDFKINWITINPGEHSKSYKIYEKTINELLHNGIERSDLIVGLGGGVVGDLAGFIAGTLFRGVDYISIPTTLLAMADSSIGGKTGIDLKFGKNLVGVFKQPKCVIIDTEFISSLPEDEYNNGMAEIIKVGLLKDKKLVDLLLEKEVDINTALYKAINIKKEIVEKDPFEEYERMLLNFGHTFGHSIEQLHKYKIKHGYAISMGMDLAVRYGILNSWTDTLVLDKLYLLLDKYKLPKFSGLVSDYVKQIDYDKKSIDEQIYFIIVTDVGVSEIKKIKKESLYELAHP